MLKSLEIEILAALVREELSGLTLLDRINKQRKKNQIPIARIGSLYPILSRFEDVKLIIGEYKEPVAGSNSPRRKYYRMTEDGKLAVCSTLAQQRLQQQQFAPLGEFA